jgi:cyclopropane-fatty-acyl-phospholipid synthase
MAPRAQGAASVSSYLGMQLEEPLPTVNLTRWPELARPKRAALWAALARLVFRRAVNRAGLLVKLPDGSCFGTVSGPLMEIRRPEAFFSRLGRDGKIGFGEAYMAGDWDAPCLGDVLEALARQIDTLVSPKLQWIRRMYEPRVPKDEDNDHEGARRNIARHYDLSNDLFATFLDGSMTYSSALFAPGADETLAEAQARKIDRLLDATGVGRGTRLLEIGTGWGELALRAARRGARVTSVTLSQEQASFARGRIEEAGLTAAVDVRVEDYRDVTGQFEAVVSIEMLEAVGERWWPEYFSALERRLVPSGRIGLQTILMAHDRLLATKASWTWIHKYIFPGGLIPSEQAIRQTVADHTKLQVVDQLHFGESYGTTLRHWRRTFDAREEWVDALGFDRTFRRMWDFYLAYSEAGFRTGYLDVAQFVLVPGGLPSSIAARE